MTKSSIALAALLALATAGIAHGATCAGSPAIPTGCRDADSCFAATGDVCNVCADTKYLSNAATGGCTACRNEAAAANARVTGTTTCNQANASFFFGACSPWGAEVDASCVACDEACSSCTGIGNNKADSMGCTACATGYYDTNGLLEAGGKCKQIMTTTDDSLMGGANAFAVLAFATITNTGAGTIINGDVGVSPGTAMTGFPPGVINGVVQMTNPLSTTAESHAGIAFGVLMGKDATVTMTGTDLGGLTLAPGVYKYNVAAAMTGVLTLDAFGDPNAIFVFQIGSSLLVNGNSKVILQGGALSCNVYWQVGSAATIGFGASMVGNIISSAATTMNIGASLNGRAISLYAAVTLDNNPITAEACGVSMCHGPHLLVPKVGAVEEHCDACHAACADCTVAGTNNKTAGCSSCSYGHYSSANTNNTCLGCRGEAAAAHARVAGTSTCSANGAAFYFKDCAAANATAAADAVCAPVTSEAQLAAAKTSGATTCGGAGAYYYQPAAGSHNARCTPCNAACTSCTGSGSDKREGCSACASGYEDSNTVAVAGGMCTKVAPPNSNAPAGATGDSPDVDGTSVGVYVLIVLGAAFFAAAIATVAYVAMKPRRATATANLKAGGDGAAGTQMGQVPAGGDKP